MTKQVTSILVLLLLPWTFIAQRFPVDVFISGPMSLPAHLQAMVMPTSSLQLTLILRDAAVASTQVRLRFYLEKNGVRLVTSPDRLFAPITLPSGVPVILTAGDLFSYFDPLSFRIIEGLNRENFQRTGGELPEGLYTLCVEVLDFQRFTEAPLSDRACLLSSFDLLDPPLIIQPGDQEVIPVPDSTLPSPVTISWLMNFSTTIQPVDYQLYIYPYDDLTRSFGLGSDFFNRPPIFDTYIPASILPLNTYLLGIQGEVELLKPGQQYVLRVQATSPDLSLHFRNRGFSDPVVFRYGEPTTEPEPSCAPPEILGSQIIDDSTYQLEWGMVGEALGYEFLLYADSQLVDSMFTTGTEITLSGLQTGLTYEGRLRSRCTAGPISGVPFYFGTDSRLPEIVFQCGVPSPDFPQRHNRTPIDRLDIGDTIMAGDFKVRITEVSGSGGSFTGKGVVIINFPFQNLLNEGEEPIQVHVTFDNIRVNTQRFLYEGFVQARGLGLNLVPPEYADFAQQVSQLDLLADEFYQGPPLLDIDFQIDQIGVKTGEVVIQGKDENGNPVTQTIPWDRIDLEIFDKAGYVYAVDANGQVTVAGTAAPRGRTSPVNTEGVDNTGSPEELAQAAILYQAGSGRYAFDEVDPGASEAERKLYPWIKVKDQPEPYYAPYKAIQHRQEDELLALLTSTEIDADSIHFQTKSGRLLPFSRDGPNYRIPVKGLFHSATENILAVVRRGESRQQVIGTFQLMHLPGMEVQVFLLPLGSSLPEGMEAQLPGYFAPVGVDLKISVLPTMTLPAELLNSEGQIDTEGSSTFANYSSGQQAIQAYVRQQLGSAYRPDAYYLLYTGAPSNNGLAGYMALGRQFGYVFDSGDEEAKGSVAATAAHELGHGIFALEHPFTRFQIPQGSTDWLMDYSEGTALPFMHWAQIYDPEFKLYLFQEDEAGGKILPEEAFIYASYIYFTPNAPVKEFACYTPTGRRFILPADAVASFYPYVDNRWPVGALTGFRIGTTEYYGWWSKADRKFLGYAQGRLTDEQQFVREGPFYPSLEAASVPLFAARVSGDCEQEILWLSSSESPGLFQLPDFVASALPLSSMQLYESLVVPQTNCGCYSGPCREWLDTYKNHPYLTSESILKRVICANPCVLKDLESFPFFLDTPSEWMENLKNIVTVALAFAFTPVMLSTATSLVESPHLLSAILAGLRAQTGAQIAKKFIIGATVDLLLQTAIYYYFPPGERPITWEEAMAQVDLVSTMASGAEATLVLESKAEEAAIAAMISCFVDGTFEDGTIREDFDVPSCARGAFSAALIHGVLELSSRGLEYLKKIPPNQILRGLTRFLQTGPPGVQAAGFQVDKKLYWILLKQVQPEPLTAGYFKELFAITDEALAGDLLRQFDDPVLRADLFESGLFTDIINLDLPSDGREKLLRDLLDKKEFRDLVNGDVGVLEAWKKIADFAHLRRDVDILTSVSKILDNHPSFIQYHGEKLNSIIDKLGQAGAKCNSCPPNTQNLVEPYMKSIDQHLDDLEYLIANFGNKEGFSGTNSLINEMAASGPKADGGSFLMHYIKNNTSEFQNLSRFEFRFNDDLLNRADVLVGNIKYEMKSWSNGGNTWNEFFGGSGNSYQQFLSYLQNTNSLDNLKYVFNSAKATESQVKTAFIGLISNASKKQEIFDSMTSQIKQSLNIEFVSDLTTSKIDEIVNAIVRI